jgi:YVTN family beta-propeller protein
MWGNTLRDLRMALLPVAAALPLVAGSARIIQTNAAGDEVHVIDPATNKVVLRIPNLEAAHGVTFSPDGSRAYFTVEGDSTLAAVDLKTGKELGRARLSGHPNNVSISKDGKLVFAGIAVAPGAVDVIDTAAMKRTRSIPVKGAVHNVYTTPDGKHVVVGSVAGRMLTVIDAQTQQTVWELPMDQGVRPIGIEAAPDGSTSRLFVQLSGLHGFAVVDFKTRKEVSRVKLPDQPVNGVAHSAAPSHGVVVSPDGKWVVSNSSIAGGVFVYSLPDLKLQGFVRTGNTPDWLTYTPDSRNVYVANAGDNNVSAVDLRTLKEVAKIPVGEVPKRNGTVVVP